MNHKASATCPNGHKVEFGTCQIEVQKMFGGTKICGSKGFEELSRGEVGCIGCKTIIRSRNCPTCNASIPVSQFERKGFFAKLG